MDEILDNNKKIKPKIAKKDVINDLYIKFSFLIIVSNNLKKKKKIIKIFYIYIYLFIFIIGKIFIY